MIQKFKNHKNLNYFVLYSAAYLAYAMHISGLGPYIPYISERTGIIQTQYSYLFTCRSLSMFIGGFIVKFLQTHSVLNHNILIGSSVVMGLFSFLFTLTVDKYWLGIWLFSASLTYASLQIIINVCTLLVNPPEQMQFWMLTTHAISGIGGLLGPFVIYLFQQHSFAIFGLLTVSAIPFFLAIKTPESNGYLPEQHSSPKLKKRVISQLLMIILGVLLFFYMGLQSIYGGWISSYAVLTKVQDIQGATVFPSIFWIVMTFCRFLFAFAPGTSSEKLKRLLEGTILFGVISLILIKLGYIKLACYLSGLLFGVSLSSIYPLVLTVPIQNGLNLQDSQTSNIVMAGVMAEGILAMFVGLLMQWFSLNMLFYSLTIIAFIMWLLRVYALQVIDAQKLAIQSSESEIELIDKNNTLNNQL